MSILAPMSIVLEENADGCFFPPPINIYGNPVVFFYYDGTGALFNLTGYTASMMVRLGVNDAAPIATYAPVLGGAAGTVSITFTAAQIATLLASLPNLTAYYDVLLTSGSGAKTRFIPQSQLTIVRAITR